MKHWTVLLVVSVGLIAVGTASFLVGYQRAATLDSLEQGGVFAVGEVVNVENAAVLIDYQRNQEEFTGVAYPRELAAYQVGDVVELRVLPSGSARVVIHGLDESLGNYLPWLIGGTGLFLAGVILGVRQIGPARAEGGLSPVGYAGRRHGGA